MRKTLILLTAIVLLCASCHRERHFITDKSYRTQVHADYLKRTAMAQGRAAQLFDCMDTLGTEEREAMEFLYAYMPYSDLADYDADFFLRQVRTAFEARDYFQWGVPEEVFRHFVLVYRVNNEDLDSARWVFYGELKERVKGLSMYEAALEVNHWCHEQVDYRAADSRTSAPLATRRTSRGRCGEESTFAVTALRSVGIPARQCYTPRWAHTDDNHAWVEVWVDGRWYHLGACEPDPELDMGWFDIPSTRCMMVHSNCFGPYSGSEEVNFQNALYAKINMLPNYAPVKKITVRVLDPLTEKPLPGARVLFKLYNYTEYYTLADIATDAQGVAQLTTGLGDLLVWATDGERYNYMKMDVRLQDSLDLYLVREPGTAYVELLDIVPPTPGEAKVTPSPEKVAANEARKAHEDSLLASYRATFVDRSRLHSLLLPNANLTEAQALDLMSRSEGNYQEIARFLNNHREKQAGLYLYEYLNSYSDKDLRDMTAATLEAHLTTYDGSSPTQLYLKGLMPARISNELVRPWRRELSEALSQIGITTAEELKAWTLEHIAVDDTGNYYHCPISPRGVLELRLSDAHSRDIFFVAACRSLGIPAYLDNATNSIYVGTPEGGWRTESFATTHRPVATAKLTLTAKGKPTYWPNFTIARYEKGEFVSFDFENDPRMEHFPATIEVEPGYYCLRTGNRYPDGEALSRLEFFELKPGQQLTKAIVLRDLAPREASGKTQLNADMELYPETTLRSFAGEKGLLFLFLGDYKEPSKHLIAEMKAHKAEFARSGLKIQPYGPLASAKPLEEALTENNGEFAPASQFEPFMRKEFVEPLGMDFRDYPLVVLVDRQGQVLFSSQGYSIGLAEQILKHIK